MGVVVVYPNVLIGICCRTPLTIATAVCPLIVVTPATATVELELAVLAVVLAAVAVVDAFAATFVTGSTCVLTIETAAIDAAGWGANIRL